MKRESILLALTYVVVVFAQTVNNGDCSAATSISAVVPVSGSVAGASSVQNGCSSSIASWHLFRCPAVETYTVNVNAGFVYEVAVISTCTENPIVCGNLNVATQINCASASESYYIMVAR